MDKNSKNAATSKRSHLAACIAAAVAASPALQAQEQENEAEQLPIEELTVVGQAQSYAVDESTSYKYTQRVLDTPKTLTIISEDLLEDRNADSLQDGLRNVAGITLAAGEGGTPTGDQMTIRGFDARNDIMMDGVREIAGYTRDVYNVEAIEVAKGPGSAVYGRGSTGGNINLRTKTARLDEFADLGVRGGSENDHRIALDMNRRLGDSSAFRVNLLTDEGEVAGRDQVFNSKDAIAISFAAGLESSSRFFIGADVQKQDNLPDYGLPWVPNNSGRPDRVITPELAAYEGMAPPVDFGGFYGNVYRDYEDIDAESLTARYERDLSASTMLRAQFRSGSVTRESVVTAPRFFFETVNGVRVYGPDVTLADEKTRDTRDTLDVLQLDLIGSYESGAMTHDLVTGIEFAEEAFERYNFVDIVDDNLDSTPELNALDNPNPFIPYTGQYGRDGTSTLAEGDTSAIYAFDTMTFGPAWQLTLGLRWDRFESRNQYDYADPSLRISAVNEETSWSLGVVHKPAERGTIYFGVGTSFNPSAEDLTATANGNDNQLDPEESISYELGTKWELVNGRLLTSAALFRTEKLHARTDDPFDDGNVETLNGEQRVDGIELGAVGQVTDRFSLSATYTHQDGEVVSAQGDDAALVGYELARTPERSYSLWGRYDFNPSWSAALGVQMSDDRYNSSDPAGRELAEGFTIYDVMVTYQVNERLGLRFNGGNLTDEQYANQIGGGHFAPGEGRNYTLSAHVSF
jgi:catecholate siderophore receptor